MGKQLESYKRVGKGKNYSTQKERSMQRDIDTLVIELRDLSHLLKVHVQPQFKPDTVLGIEIATRLDFAEQTIRIIKEQSDHDGT